MSGSFSTDTNGTAMSSAAGVLMDHNALQPQRSFLISGPAAIIDVHYFVKRRSGKCN